jgi:hypothetical protein
MNILGLVTKKEEKKPLGVCIPEHRKKIISEAVAKKFSNSKSNNATKDLLITKNGLFRVNGTYRVIDTLMLSGIVEEGTIRKRMKSIKDGRTLNVTEVRRGNEVVENLCEGEEGTIFISAKLIPIIGYEDVLSFTG